jgi:hypothetical protein
MIKYAIINAGDKGVIPLGTLSHQKINTIKSLLYFTGLQVSDDRLHRLCCESPFEQIDPMGQTAGMIIACYRQLCESGNESDFRLSSESLAQMVDNIDRMPNSLGFLYPDVLKRECELIVPRELTFDSSPWDLVQPFQLLRVNDYHLHCRGIVFALFLALIKLLVQRASQLKSCDWTPLFKSLCSKPIDELGSELYCFVIQELQKEAE